MCSECKKEIRKDEMVTHKMNHMKLKSFGRKILKEKSVKPATGYGMWQSEERKRILETNPVMNFNDVSSELGRRWRLVSKECKNVWKQKAVDLNETLKASKSTPEVNVATLVLHEDSLSLFFELIEELFICRVQHVSKLTLSHHATS